MAFTQTSVANQALYIAGADRIDDLSDGSPSALVLSEVYDQSIREILRFSHNWACATYRVILAVAGGDNLTPFDYKYQLPSDPEWLRTQAILDFEGHADGTADYNEYDDESQWFREGSVIYTSIQNAGLKYSGFTETASLDAWVIDVLILLLASKAAYRIGTNGQKARELRQDYLTARIEAAATDGSERQNPTHALNRRSNRGYLKRGDWARSAGTGSHVVRNIQDS